MSLVFNYHKNLPKATPLKEKYLSEQVIELKKIFQPVQKSKEWYDMRSNMLTASDWGTVLGENHYSNSNEVLKKKCGDDTFITNAAMQWGNKYESVAVSVYEYRNNVAILEFGCLRHPSISFLGASPDGITKEGVMLEIKCPSSRKITGITPPYYWCQVQGQLEVCELDRCDFLECSFKEYENETDYLNDHYENNYLMNKFGHEKGIVVEFFKKSDKTFYYDYSPVCLIGDDLEIWKKNIIEKHENNNTMFSTFSYWYLQEVSCIPIYRNQEWFNNAKVELEIFWNKVLKYRILGFDVLKEDLIKERDTKKNLKLQMKEEKEKEKEKEKLEKNAQKKLKKNESTKKESTKNQKKMRDYIILSDDNNTKLNDTTNDTTNDITMNDRSSESSNSSNNIDYSSDNDFSFNTNTSLFN